MCCAYLLYKKLARDAAEAMDIYAKQRSKILAGLTVPSQKRYALSQGKLASSYRRYQ